MALAARTIIPQCCSSVQSQPTASSVPPERAAVFGECSLLVDTKRRVLQIARRQEARRKKAENTAWEWVSEDHGAGSCWEVAGKGRIGSRVDSGSMRLLLLRLDVKLEYVNLF
ncbi:unnamed protein product [Pleuronectes platessa]|uniref:Uncharacterized protein n=1 Tax=Pleuronectes platessa TaxID=8262 RepID=A0A9N7V5Z2_PLEPL|nr:unnamed protein product [Pleuronectes platessa]